MQTIKYDFMEVYYVHISPPKNNIYLCVLQARVCQDLHCVIFLFLAFLVFIFLVFYNVHEFFFRDFTYLKERKSMHKQGEGTGEGEADSLCQAGSPTRAWSQDSGIMTWAEGRRLIYWDTQAPPCIIFIFKCYINKNIKT